MSKKPKKAPSGTHIIGYGRPPESGKIKLGEVRNPWGRTGKPADDVDAFELAMKQPIRVKIDGVAVTMPAEQAMHIKQMSAAIGGAAAPYKTIVEELRSRRSRLGREPTREELEAESRELEQKKILAARIVACLEDFARLKKQTGERLSERSDADSDAAK